MFFFSDELNLPYSQDTMPLRARVRMSEEEKREMGGGVVMEKEEKRQMVEVRLRSHIL